MNSNDTTANAPLIDFDQLKSACDGDIPLMRELMDMYFGQADQIMGTLRQAIQKGSIDEVNHMSHKLAGSSLACGLTAIVPPLRQMEHNAKAGNLDGADVSIEEAAKFLEQLRQAIQEHLRQVGG